MKHISLDERPEKKFVKILMVVFGIMCLFTAGWWALYLVKNPSNENVFWIATLFLLFFGLYQIYAGLGMATRYILIDKNLFTVRQNSLSRPRRFPSESFDSVEIRRMDILLKFTNGSKYRVKIGLRYPGLGENIRDELVHFCEEHDIRIVYNYD